MYLASMLPKIVASISTVAGLRRLGDGLESERDKGTEGVHPSPREISTSYTSRLSKGPPGFCTFGAWERKDKGNAMQCNQSI